MKWCTVVAGKTTLQSQQIRQLQMQKRPGQVQIQQGQQKVTGNQLVIYRFKARRIACTSYGNVSGWMAGWVSVTRRYCIKTAKPI